MHGPGKGVGGVPPSTPCWLVGESGRHRWQRICNRGRASLAQCKVGKGSVLADWKLRCFFYKLNFLGCVRPSSPSSWVASRSLQQSRVRTGTLGHNATQLPTARGLGRGSLCGT